MVKSIYLVFPLLGCILCCVFTPILGDTMASKCSETQIVESLQILRAKNHEDKCLGELKICACV